MKFGDVSSADQFATSSAFVGCRLTKSLGSVPYNAYTTVDLSTGATEVYRTPEIVLSGAYIFANVGGRYQVKVSILGSNFSSGGNINGRMNLGDASITWPPGGGYQISWQLYQATTGTACAHFTWEGFLLGGNVPGSRMWFEVYHASGDGVGKALSVDVSLRRLY
jgi:hypothetical protein